MFNKTVVQRSVASTDSMVRHYSYLMFLIATSSVLFYFILCCTALSVVSYVRAYFFLDSIHVDCCSWKLNAILPKIEKKNIAEIETIVNSNL